MSPEPSGQEKEFFIFPVQVSRDSTISAQIWSDFQKISSREPIRLQSRVINASNSGETAMWQGSGDIGLGPSGTAPRLPLHMALEATNLFSPIANLLISRNPASQRVFALVHQIGRTSNREAGIIHISSSEELVRNFISASNSKIKFQIYDQSGDIIVSEEFSSGSSLGDQHANYMRSYWPGGSRSFSARAISYSASTMIGYEPDIYFWGSPAGFSSGVHNRDAAGDWQIASLDRNYTFFILIKLDPPIRRDGARASVSLITKN